MLKIYTAQYRYNGPDRVDITYKTEDPFGDIFKPTANLVFAYKENRINEQIYSEHYRQLMLRSYYDNQHRWDSMLMRRSVTFVCYCPAGEFCHRLLLANFFVKLGGQYIRERKEISKKVWE